MTENCLVYTMLGPVDFYNKSRAVRVTSNWHEILFACELRVILFIVRVVVIFILSANLGTP